MYNSIYDKDFKNTMKLQDLHPFDSFIVGINNIYFIDYKGDFHINAPFIIAANKTISTGNTYVLIYSRNSKNCIVHPVRLQDAYYEDGTIYLIVQDILSQETFTIASRLDVKEIIIVGFSSILISSTMN